MREILAKLNVFAECRELRLGLWACPAFLFVIMGLVNIVSVVTAYIFATRLVEDPQLAAFIVIIVSLVIFLLGAFIVSGFNRIAEANRMKSEFLNIVSHQLRTPLSIFKWAIELMEGEERARGHDSKYLPILSDHTERMVRMVSLLLDVSRIDAGRFALQRVPISLDRLTRDAIHALEAYAKASGVTIVFSGGPDSPVRGDAERLRMVIQNLIDNAIRYSSPAGAITISITALSAEWQEWRVRDQGIGIPKAQQKYIFQKFYRATNGTHHETHGTGLGLYIARAVVEELGGKIGFESAEGKGSTFWFRLPMYK